MENKRGFEFSFAWLFAIIAGAFIIFLAIYSTMKIIGTEKYQLDTMTAKQLSIIFEPFETDLASGKASLAALNEETRIYSSCFSDGSFGKQKISLSTKSSIGKKWSEPGGEISITNKYIFSNATEQGRQVYFFSKPFEMPWKISEIIFLTAGKYCFANTPEEIADEISGLNIKSIVLENCSNEIKVCFNSRNCKINVVGECLNCENKYEYGYIEKEGKKLYFSGSLIYGAVFSSPEIYECNVKRLMKRLFQESAILEDETNFLAGKCGSRSFAVLANLARNLKNSQDLILINKEAKNLDGQNEASKCKLW